jgi:hypothetical protein
MQLVNTAEAEPIKSVLIPAYTLITHEPVPSLLLSVLHRQITDIPAKGFSLCS